ncbi:MAG: exopolyphosphatase [Trichlorobacter sp.]|jgi:exopolyphosphatase/guanosine-5'-triphosphate,3'-diphosphate pyrophosphatase
MTQRIAAIDLGTNTARLLIADRAFDGTMEQRYLERTIVRLGGGFSRDTGLSVDAIQRTLDCLNQFARQIAAHQVDTVRAVATCAVRDAANGNSFVRQVHDETGISLSVISGDMEGTLTVAGVLYGLTHPAHAVLMFDVGGGSTEFTLAIDGVPIFVISLPLGVVRLTEGQVTPEAMTDKIARELDCLLLALNKSGISLSPKPLLVATAGTATTLAAISLQMAEYDYRLVNNHILSCEEVERILAMLLPMSCSERLKVPGLEPGREDLIIAGSLITQSVMRRLGYDSLVVSDFGLLEGLVVTPS